MFSNKPPEYPANFKKENEEEIKLSGVQLELTHTHTSLFL